MIKISGKKNKVLIMFSAAIAISLIASTFFINKKIADAFSSELFPSFGGKVSNLEICCTGEKWNQGSTGDYGGNLILYWSSMLTAVKGGGTISDGVTTLGKASYGGICLDISEECESGDTMPFVLQVGVAQNAGGGSQ